MEKLKDEELIEQYYAVEYALEDCLNNLQDNDEIDKLFKQRREFIKELRKRKLEFMIANSQADLYF